MKTFWTTLMTFLGSEGVNHSTLSFSCKKFKKKFRPISTSGECTNSRDNASDNARDNSRDNSRDNPRDNSEVNARDIAT